MIKISSHWEYSRIRSLWSSTLHQRISQRKLFESVQIIGFLMDCTLPLGFIMVLRLGITIGRGRKRSAIKSWSCIAFKNMEAPPLAQHIPKRVRSERDGRKVKAVLWYTFDWICRLMIEARFINLSAINIHRAHSGRWWWTRLPTIIRLRFLCCSCYPTSAVVIRSSQLLCCSWAVWKHPKGEKSRNPNMAATMVDLWPPLTFSKALNWRNKR